MTGSPETADGSRPPAGRALRGLGPPVGPTITEFPSPPDVRRRDAFYRRALAAADLAAGAAAIGAAGAIGNDEALPLAVWLALPLLVLASKLGGLYDRDELLIAKDITLDELPKLANVAALMALLAAFTGAAADDGWLAGPRLLLFWVVLVALLALFRSAARRFGLRHTPFERCLVTGDADASEELRRRLAESRHINSVVLGYVPLRDRIRADDPEPLGPLDEIEEIVHDYEIQRVIVAARDSGPDPSLEVVRRAKAVGVKVSVLPRILEVVGSSAAFDDVDGMTVLGVRRFGLRRSSAFAKRAVDLVGGTAGLVFAAPVLALLAAAIRLETRGPILFRQQRVGRDGEVFEIVKFRTMVADAEAQKAALAKLNETQGLFKMADDPRVTRVGRFLRRTSLDELPQLLNVIKGHMSLVGPRPLVLEEDRQVEDWHRRRLHIKPGMTGPWQILGSGRIPLYEMVKIDYLYAANWSLWGDAKLLLRTVLYVLGRHNR